MQIEGEITGIIFRNESNSYTVAKLLYNGIETVVVGKIYTIAVGERLKLTGEFSSTRYGNQFNIESYEIVYPTSVNGIKKFLGSGLIKGVGAVTAKQIVDKFGRETLDIIEFQPNKLTEIPRISEKKALAIHDNVVGLKQVQSIIIHLGQFDISVNMALKIYEVFKEETLKVIQTNPFSLVEHIDGIGFATADKIASKIGIDENSEYRIRAGVLHCLKEASEKNGHTFLPYDTLINNVAKLLNLDEVENNNLFENVINTLAMEKIIAKFFHKYTTIVALSKFNYYEHSVADKLALLCISQEEEYFNIDDEINHFEIINKITFHNEQIEAIKTAINSGVCVITGGPGTGKTTIIKCILSILDKQNKQTALLAPTGRASKRMSLATGKEASTIHRALAMDFATKNFIFNEKNPLPYNAIIIDEFSMVDISLAYNLLKAITRDCKVIIVGDKDQLPSVGAGNVLADIIESEVVKVAYLTQIFRQEENSLIITNAHKINQGEMPDIDNNSKDFFFENKIELEEIKNSIVSLVTKRLPQFLNISPTQIQVLAPLKIGICGIENLNRELQEKINPASMFKPELEVGKNVFRQGDKVMQTTNNYNIEWRKNNISMNQNDINITNFHNNIQGQGVYNGDIGYIREINRQNGETVVEFEDGRECVYPRTEISQLSLAYAITIHKSQGSEFDVVIIPSIAGPSLILNRNLIYTAVTRAKKMVVIVGEKKNLKRMISNKFLLKRNTLLKDYIKESFEKAKILFGE